MSDDHSTSPAPIPLSPREGSIAVGHPVDVASGVFFSQWQDAAIGGPLTVRVERTYNTSLLLKRRAWEPLGPGWAISFDERVHPTLDGLIHIDSLGQETLFIRGEQQARSSGARFITVAGGVELEALDEHTLRLVRYHDDRRRNMSLFRRLMPGGDYELVAIERGAGHRIEVARDRLRRPSQISHARSGRGVRIAYNKDGLIDSCHLVNRRQPDGLLLSRFEYDAQRRLVVVGDDRGVRERFEYDSAGRMISELRRNGALNRMRYDGEGRCIHVVGTDGFQERRLAYHPGERRTDVTDSHGAMISYEYNQAGQVLRMRMPYGEEAMFAYDPDGRLAGQTLPNGQVYGYEHDPGGHLVAVSMPDGRKVSREYDEHHRLVAAVDGERRTELGYDPQHNLTSVKLPGGALWRFEFDGQGDCVATVDPNGARTTTKYDALGDCVGETTGKGALSRFAHDEWGQPTEELNPFGHPRRFEYDRHLRLVAATDAEGRAWRFERSPDGNQLVRHDATGRWEFHYNSCGKVTEIVDPQGQRTTYVWDSEPGQLLEVRSPSGDSYKFEYDLLGRLTKRTAWDGTVTSFEWKRGGLAAETNGRGQRSEYKYDSAARLVERKGPDDSLSYEYGPDGRVAVAVENGVELGFEYDLAGRIVAERQDGIEVRRRYDAKGRMVWLGSDLEDNLLYEWDANDRCERIIRDAGSVGFTRDLV
ncbi:MAG TPA: DUF6531 domain-containing protein, partial [Polyangia bacterium]|nr:DUF6531 domain-containing protein [Polyangia bacterium]